MQVILDDPLLDALLTAQEAQTHPDRSPLFSFLSPSFPPAAASLSFY